MDHLAREYALELDRCDRLAEFRDRFYIPPGAIYLDGNSLGLASRAAEAEILQTLDDWKTHGVAGWTTEDRGWFRTGEDLGDRQAMLVGARPGEIVVTGSTTVNLHSLVATFYQPAGTRTRILADRLNFPSDIYALESQVRLRGLDPARHLILVGSRDGRTIDEVDLIRSMNDDIALVVLPSVLYRSGQLLDVERLARAARARDIPIGIDCSHSAGVVPHRLHDWEVDFAFWCNYKYLNGGPGAIGSLFVHERHHGLRPGLTGWWGFQKERQFDLALDFESAANAGAWQIGTPSILGMAGLRGSLDLFHEAGIARIREKSLALTAYLIDLVDSRLSASPYSFRIGTPRDAERRGGHLAIEHPDAIRIAKALRARGVVPDFRPPDVIRLAPIAFYTSYVELWDTVEILREIVDHGEQLRFAATRDLIS
ncbi:MAG TPA: kynureninase [Chloroflexota bacterium]|nr:kynureninase [Chloroflexota bacterium]